MLTKEIADIVVKETMKRLGRNINIFDHNGIVLSSGDKIRIDTFHEGALQVVTTGSPLIITSDDVKSFRGVKPGINFPIFNQDEIIGVVGISGPPEEIEDFGSLVVLMTELLIKQQLLSHEVEWKFRTSETVMEELLSEQLNQPKINQKLLVLNKSLSAPYFPIALSLKQVDREQPVIPSLIYKDIESILNPFSCLYAFIDSETFLMLVHSKSVHEIDQVQNLLERYMFTKYDEVRMASGYQLDELQQVRSAFNQLRLALQLSNDQRLKIRDFEIQILLKDIDEARRMQVKSRIQKQLSSELKQTLDVFFSHDLNVKATAEALYIHRNTLLYRLNKIHELTGYNPRRFYDSLQLKLFDWL
jgi:carbohydrate diacid regulator